MSDRNLAVIDVVKGVRPIPDADAVEAVSIRGWTVVSGKGNVSPGDKVVYFEIDSMLDVEDPRFAFLAPRGIRTDATGVKGHVLKTIRLRGQYSQGLIIPISEFPELAGLPVGTCVDDILGVRKWEPPLPAELAGQARGLRPSWIWKTDAERIQNIAEEALETLSATEVYATEKLDGSSASFGIIDGEFHVCSRNTDLKFSENNTFWKIAKRFSIEERMREWVLANGPKIFVVQGELYGEGINGNRLGVKGHHFAIFNVDADRETQNSVEIAGGLDLAHVPVLDLPIPLTLDEALLQADGLKSQISTSRLTEGIVWRRSDGGEIAGHRAVKVISNKYLLKER